MLPIRSPLVENAVALALLWVMRAVNHGKLHTPKYHRTNRPIRLTDADVERPLTLKRLRKTKDDDWMFPNRIKNAGVPQF